jgi:hypothetical protein
VESLPDNSKTRNQGGWTISIAQPPQAGQTMATPTSNEPATLKLP